MPTPHFLWNDEAARFTDARGRFVAGEKIRDALDDYLDAKSAAARAISEQLQRREISLREWQDYMGRELTKNALNAAALARGGAARLDDAALESVGRFVQSELKYLEKFAVGIELGQPTDGRFLNRTKQFMQAARTHFHEAQRAEMNGRGFDEERSIRHARDSCAGCLFWSSAGWQLIGTVALPGERDCRRNCRCTLEYRLSSASLSQRNAKIKFDDDEEENSSARRPRQRNTGRAKQELRDQDRQKDPNWDDPDILESFQGGAENGTGPEIISKKLLTHLRRFNDTDSDEFGAVIERKTGTILRMKRGQKGTVNLELGDFDEYRDIVVVHTHDDNTSFSDSDWQGFILNPDTSVDLVVTPDYVCSLRKIQGRFDPYPVKGEGSAMLNPDEVWEPKYRKYLEQFAQEKRQDAHYDAIEQTNQEMGELYGVEFKRAKM